MRTRPLPETNEYVQEYTTVPLEGATADEYEGYEVPLKAVDMSIKKALEDDDCNHKSGVEENIYAEIPDVCPVNDGPRRYIRYKRV